MMKRVMCAIFVALCLTLSSYGNSDLTQQMVGKWQRVGGSKKLQPCEFQNWYELNSDATYTFYMACNNIMETGTLSINAGNNTLSILPNGLSLPFVYSIVSISKKKLVLRVGNITYKYKKADVKLLSMGAEEALIVQ